MVTIGGGGDSQTLPNSREQEGIRHQPISVSAAFQLYSLNLHRCETKDLIGLFRRISNS